MKKSFLLRYFIAGVVAILPFVVTVAIVLWVSNFFIVYLGPKTMFGKVLNLIGIQFLHEGVMAYIVGWGLIILLIFTLGFFIDLITSQALVRYVDSLMKRVPIIGTIYGTVRQFTDLMNGSKNSELNNMSPVYCRFGHMPGTLCLALLPTCEDYIIEGVHYRLVMIPTAPVPFGGALFFVPKEDVFPAQMSIETLISFYVSMGVSRNDSLEFNGDNQGAEKEPQCSDELSSTQKNKDSDDNTSGKESDKKSGQEKVLKTEGPSEKQQVQQNQLKSNHSKSKVRKK